MKNSHSSLPVIASSAGASALLLGGSEGCCPDAGCGTGADGDCCGDVSVALSLVQCGVCAPSSSEGGLLPAPEAGGGALSVLHCWHCEFDSRLDGNAQFGHAHSGSCGA